MSITTSIADLHNAVDEMRLLFLNQLNRGNDTMQTGDSSRGSAYDGAIGARNKVDPFDAADRTEARELASSQKRITELMNEGQPIPSSTSATSAIVGTATATSNTLTGGTTGFVSAPSSGLATSGGAFGSGAPANSLGFGAAAATAPAAGGFGLTTTPGAPTKATGGSFGTPSAGTAAVAAPAIGGFGAPAPAVGTTIGTFGGGAGDLAGTSDKKPGSRNRRGKR